MNILFANLQLEKIEKLCLSSVSPMTIVLMHEYCCSELTDLCPTMDDPQHHFNIGQRCRSLHREPATGDQKIDDQIQVSDHSNSFPSFHYWHYILVGKPSRFLSRTRKTSWECRCSGRIRLSVPIAPRFPCRWKRKSELAGQNAGALIVLQSL